MNLNTFKEDLENYAIDCNIQGFSENTINGRLSMLNTFYKWVVERGHNPKTDDEWLKVFKKFLHHKKNVDGVTKSYVSQLTIAQRMFNRSIGESWLDGFSTPKTDKTLPRIISDKEFQSMVEAVENRNQSFESDYYNEVKIRDKFVLVFLYNTGLRVNELVNVKVSDLDLDDKSVRVLGKGSKERVVYLNDEVMEAYEEYKKLLPDNDDAYLIVNFRRGLSHYSKVTTRTVQNIVRKAGRRAGVKRTVTPHVLRHAYATNLVRKGVNVRAVQMLMGHSSLETTQLYVNLSLNDIKEELMKVR